MLIDLTGKGEFSVTVTPVVRLGAEIEMQGEMLRLLQQHADAGFQTAQVMPFGTTDRLLVVCRKHVLEPVVEPQRWPDHLRESGTG